MCNINIVKIFTDCFARKIVQRLLILYQLVLVVVLIILLTTNSGAFGVEYNLFCYLYTVLNIWCAVVETDSAMVNPKRSRDLTTIFVVLFMQFFLAIWCVSLFTYLLLHMDNDAKLSVSIIFIADFVNQLLWALYLTFRFIKQLFPKGEPKVIYQESVDEMLIVVEDPEVQLPSDTLANAV